MNIIRGACLRRDFALNTKTAMLGCCRSSVDSVFGSCGSGGSGGLGVIGNPHQSVRIGAASR